MNPIETLKSSHEVFAEAQQIVDGYFAEQQTQEKQNKSSTYKSFRHLCETPQKLKYTYKADDILGYIALRLNILADLFEAHFVPGDSVEAQKQAIEIARFLAEAFENPQSSETVMDLLNNDFDRLCRLMLHLKQQKLRTETGQSWFNIMRGVALDAVESSKRYMQVERSKRQPAAATTANSRKPFNLSQSAKRKISREDFAV